MLLKKILIFQNLLYIGTDNGAYLSFDKGINWNPFSHGLNKVAVHDLVIQNEEKDLLLGTHGRSIYKTDLSIIYNYLDNIEDSNDGVVFKVDDISYCSRCGTKRNSWDPYIDQKIKVMVFSKKEQQNNLSIFENGVKIHNKKVYLQKGFQEVILDTHYTDQTIKSVYKKNKNNELKKAENQKILFSKRKIPSKNW